MNSETKACQNCKSNFQIEPEDFKFYEKMQVPAPTFCPECRMIRRMAWMGYRILYKRKCDFTGEEMITVHHQDIPQKVYKQEVWWSDKWDPKDYGRDYDFSRSFFEQWLDLFRDVPLPALYTEYSSMINSEYCNAASTDRNCYLCFKCDGTEDSAYINTAVNLKNCFDVSYSFNTELSYESVNLTKCYRTFFSQDIEDSYDIWFSRDLMGCSNCIGSINLRNKNYHIFNDLYSKEEYEKLFFEYGFGSTRNISEFRKKAEDFMLKHPRKAFHGRKNINTTGDYIFNSKNVHDSYMVDGGENAKYVQLVKFAPLAWCWDYTMFGMNAEWIYDSTWVGINVSNIKFGFWNYNAHHLEYCFGCHGSGNLFGCVGIRKGEYCILNKQYSKEEYTQLVEKIKKQMMEMPYKDDLKREYKYGEYFPSEFGPWAYNESHAVEFFPLTKEEALEKGFLWRDFDPKEYSAATAKVPDNIKDTEDSILSAILKCENCGKNYQFAKMELDFHRKMNLPLPAECPLCRDQARVKQLNPIKIFDRKCDKCGENIKTSYSPDRPEIVYCEECYLKEIV